MMFRAAMLRRAALACRPRRAATRWLSTTSAEPDFHTAADETLERLLNAAIGLEDHRDDVEAELAAGVLNITLEKSRESWVINKQTPNRQIWLSSPRTGPCRYELGGDGVWRHTRDGTDLFALLRTELDLEIEELD
ncbi:hypothetical protein M885DRAFT_530599 [Pelagophyceae sp. CCMP2097]|nr:hypothetical protein M885DRAFT_530599 [Pelagophyceae sp. CCMP2097]